MEGREVSESENQILEMGVKEEERERERAVLVGKGRKLTDSLEQHFPCVSEHLLRASKSPLIKTSIGKQMSHDWAT